MRVAVDTNVFVYAEGVNGAAMQERAIAVIQRVRHNDLFVSVQVLGELFNVLTRKAARPREAARTVILGWRDMFSLSHTSDAVMLGALDLASNHQLGIWDAVIVSAAAESRCRVLLSQDLHDGFMWGGVTVVNPFSPAPHPLLAGILEADRA